MLWGISSRLFLYLASEGRFRRYFARSAMSHNGQSYVLLHHIALFFLASLYAQHGIMGIMRTLQN